MEKEDANIASHRNRPGFLPCLLLSLIGLAVFANTLRNPFVYDDMRAIYNNDDIRSFKSIDRVLFSSRDSGLIRRPLLSLSFALNYAVDGYNVEGYHAVNILVHILAAWALYGIVRRTLASDRLRDFFGKDAAVLAWIAAALWMVHPLQTGSVTYTVQRAESLMGLFYLLTLYCAIRAMGPNRSIIWSILALMCCALGMGTKAVMVTAPLMVLFYDRTFQAGSFICALKHRWRLYAGLVACWCITLGLLLGIHRSSNQPNYSVLDFSLNQFVVIAHYLRLAFWPSPLCLDYSRAITKDVGQIIPSALLILAMLSATSAGLLRNRSWGYIGAWFFGILAPTSSFLPVAVELMAEHRMYLPLAAIVVLLVTMCYRVVGSIGKRPAIGDKAAYRTGVCLAAVAICSLSFATVRRNMDYASVLTMWEKVLDVAPDSGRAHTNLATELLSQGRLEEALGHYRRAHELLSDNYVTNYNMGVTLSKLDRTDEAATYYRRAVEIKADFFVAHYNLIDIYVRQGELEKALEHLQMLVVQYPDNSFAHANLGIMYLKLKKNDQAIRHLRRALEIRPDNGPAREALKLARSAVED